MSNATPVTDANFDSEVLRSGTPVLVDFWAPWCGPCRAVGPAVDAIAQEFAGKLKVVKLNTDEEQEITIKYGVVSIPTLMVFKNGEMVERVMGNRPKADLAALVSRHVCPRGRHAGRTARPRDEPVTGPRCFRPPGARRRTAACTAGPPRADRRRGRA